MKLAILANNANSFVKPMAEGLRRMLARASVDSTVFYEGLATVRQAAAPPRHLSRSSRLRERVRSILHECRFYNLVRHLRRYDAVVVVGTIPSAYVNSSLRDSQLRRFLPDTPIILYSNLYLPTRGAWARRLLEGDPARRIPRGEHWGLNRYDWYLVSTVVSDYPMSKGCDMYSAIGLDLDDGTLEPAVKEDFIALIDFEQPGHLRERAVQITALEQTATKYVVLHGSYPIEDIRRIYKQCSLYFVAHRETFGLPICELQACGAYVLSPYANWCPAHWIKNDLFVAGPGQLSSNFIVYDNNATILSKQIEAIRAGYDPQTVFRTFVDQHPQFFRGDLDALKGFVRNLERRVIHAGLHRQHPRLPELVEALGR